jgi:16S rRNA (guanine527-N7)-methyltransferase
MSDRFADRLLPRLEGVSILLSAEEIRLLSEYWTLLERWNAKVNLTALPLDGAPSQSIDRLLVEPLLASRLMPPQPVTWFDLGSGGGSPAVPLKVVTPNARLVMVESRSRKAAFLREVVRTLGLASTEVLNDRFEHVADDQPGVADCITIRAVKADRALVRTIRRLLKPSGRLILFENSEVARNAPDFDSIDEVIHPAMRTRIRAVVPRGTKD